MANSLTIDAYDGMVTAHPLHTSPRTEYCPAGKLYRVSPRRRRWGTPGDATSTAVQWLLRDEDASQTADGRELDESLHLADLALDLDRHVDSSDTKTLDAGNRWAST